MTKRSLLFVLFALSCATAASAATRVLSAAELEQVTGKLGEAKAEEQQCFVTKFRNLGDVWFVAATMPPPLGFRYFLFKDGKEISRFEPNRDIHSWTGYAVKAVTFRDFNDDGLEDVGVVAQYMAGAGPEAAVPFAVGEVYRNDGKGGFWHDAQIQKALDAANVSSMKLLLRFAGPASRKKG